MIFCSELSFPEGPVVVVEMGVESGCITHIGPKGDSKRVIAKTGRPNGLAVDKSGFIWIAESMQCALLRMKMDGKVEVFATACQGKPFLWPNDLCFGPDGAVYMTDTGVRVRDFKVGTQPRIRNRRSRRQGLPYRPSHGRGGQIDGGLRFANGIAFGPDGNLYVNETLTEWSTVMPGGAGVNSVRGNALAKAIPTPFWVIRVPMVWLSAKMADCTWRSSSEAAWP